VCRFSRPSRFDARGRRAEAHWLAHYICEAPTKVGNVLVGGTSSTLPDNPHQARVNAADLTAAGIEHLRNLIGSPAAQEAEASVQATRQAAVRDERSRAAAELIGVSIDGPKHQPRAGVFLSVVVTNGNAEEHTVDVHAEMQVLTSGSWPAQGWWSVAGTGQAIVPPNGQARIDVLMSDVPNSLPGSEKGVLSYLTDSAPDEYRYQNADVLAVDSFAVP
jgi:hypothetical protein